MASLFEPVGPLGPRVYWRRRILVLLVVLVLLFLVLRACGGGGGDAEGVSSTGNPSPTASASKSPKATSSASATASSTSTPSKSATAAPTCKDSDISVTARPSKSSYAVGDTVNITYVVSTKDGVTCKRDVGGTANEVRVVQNGRIIWSSDFCSPGGKKDIRTLGPDDSFSVLVAWDGDVTTTECADDRLPAPAGDYQVMGRNGAITGPSAKLTLG